MDSKERPNSKNSAVTAYFSLWTGETAAPAIQLLCLVTEINRYEPMKHTQGDSGLRAEPTASEADGFSSTRHKLILCEAALN